MRRCIVHCDFDASVFLIRSSKDHSTSYCFLDMLPVKAGVPDEVCSFVAEISSALDESTQSEKFAGVDQSSPTSALLTANIVHFRASP